MSTLTKSLLSGVGVVGFTSMGVVAPVGATVGCPEPFSLITVDGAKVCELVITEDTVVSLGTKSIDADAAIPSNVDPATIQALLVGAGGPGLKEIFFLSSGEGGAVVGTTLEGFEGDLVIRVGEGSYLQSPDYLYIFAEESFISDGSTDVYAAGGYSSYFTTVFVQGLSQDEGVTIPVGIQTQGSEDVTWLDDPYSVVNQLDDDSFWFSTSDLSDHQDLLWESELYSLFYMGGFGSNPFFSYEFADEPTPSEIEAIFKNHAPIVPFNISSIDDLDEWEAVESDVSGTSYTTIRNSGNKTSAASASVGQLVMEPVSSSVTRVSSSLGFLENLRVRSEIKGFDGGRGIVPSESFTQLNLFSNLDSCYAGGGNNILGANVSCGAAADGGVLGSSMDDFWGAGNVSESASLVPGRANSGAGALPYYIAETEEYRIATFEGTEFAAGEDGVVILRFPAYSMGFYSAPVPFGGPVATDLGADGSQDVYITGRGQQVKIVGDKLADVTAVEIDGVQIDVDSADNSEITFTAPADFTPGEYAVSMIFAGGSVLIQERILFTGSGGNIPTGVCTESPKVWTKRISETQAKMYIKCPDVDVKYSATHQQDGGEYVEFFGRTLDDETDSSQFFNGTDRYFVRTIDLATKSRIKIYENGELKWQVVYNEGSFTG